MKMVIFDFDGVLADTNEMWVNLYREIAHQVGIDRTLTRDEITKDFGERYEIVLRGLVGEENMDEALPMLEKRIHSSEWLKTLEPLPHAKEVLDKLKEKGVRLAVVTGNPSDILERSLKAVGMKKYFEMTVAADQVDMAKPDPEALLKVISELEIPKSEVVYVGDAANDVKAAKAAGIKVITVLTGALDREQAEELDPDEIISDLSELFEVLG